MVFILCEDYNAPGTVELVLNRNTYRVNQSFFGINNEHIYTISLLQPAKRVAKCRTFMRMDGCSICPDGFEQTYIEVEPQWMPLAELKVSCKSAFCTHHMKYEQDNFSPYSFAYFNEIGRIHYHPTGRPSACE